MANYTIVMYCISAVAAYRGGPDIRSGAATVL